MIWFGFKTPFKKRQLSFTFSSLVNTLYNSLLSIKCSRKSSFFFFLIAIALVNLNVLFQYSTGIDGRLVKGKKTPKTKPSLLLPNKRESWKSASGRGPTEPPAFQRLRNRPKEIKEQV